MDIVFIRHVLPNAAVCQGNVSALGDQRGHLFLDLPSNRRLAVPERIQWNGYAPHSKDRKKDANPKIACHIRLKPLW